MMAVIRWATLCGRAFTASTAADHLHVLNSVAIVAPQTAEMGGSMAMFELDAALGRLAERSEKLADKVDSLSKQNSKLRREVADALRDLDGLIEGVGNA
jgi:chaperonin cofactor prefoldin